MDDIYSFLINDEMFAKIELGTKSVHLFVNDNKHKTLASGNVISFVCGEQDNQQKIEAVIESILYFPTVVEAIEVMGKEKCGFKNSQTFEKASDLFLSTESSYEQIEKYGIGAISFKLK